eukprot:3087421-Pyramimonas_sp.AAC.1
MAKDWGAIRDHIPEYFSRLGLSFKSSWWAQDSFGTAVLPTPSRDSRLFVAPACPCSPLPLEPQVRLCDVQVVGPGVRGERRRRWERK